MSVIGSPIETSLVQAAQAQQVASKDRDREKSARDIASRQFQDLVELRVAGVEAAEALRKLPSNESEQAEEEHRGYAPHDEPEQGSHVDVQA